MESLRFALSGAGLRLVIVSFETRSVDPVAADRLTGEARRVRTVACSNHVREDLQEGAGTAGCGEVLSKGSFTRRLPEVLREGLGA